LKTLENYGKTFADNTEFMS